MDPISELHLKMTRRTLFGKTGAGIGLAALASLFGEEAIAAPPSNLTSGEGGLPSFPHFAPKAKRVIYLTQSGAPSQVDLFDYKPELEKLRGTDLPESVRGGQRLTTMTASQKSFPLRPSVAPFQQYGKSGIWMSSLLPHIGSIADDVCLVRSLHTESINHAPGMCLFLTGAEQPGRPSTGAWLSYGLGSLSRDLPSFVVLTSLDRNKTCGQLLYEYYWGSGFLPTRYQGVRFRSGGDPVLYLSDPAGLPRSLRRDQLDTLAALNQLQHTESGDPEVATRIAQYEMAYRMQASVPELTDLKSEPQSVLDLYGPDVKRPGSYAQNCLLARRLIEKGTRFVQLFHVGWDQHGQLNKEIRLQCEDTDQPSAGLVKDLKQRGLLEDTLVIWGGEFGRTVFSQGNIDDPKSGRDHHPRCFSAWMAGGGVKPGTVWGETDPFSYNIAKDPVHIHDLQATILHLLGIDHTRFVYRFQGRDFRLTDVSGEVVHGILRG